jgi:DNA polymerase III subunit epsilon
MGETRVNGETRFKGLLVLAITAGITLIAVIAWVAADVASLGQARALAEAGEVVISAEMLRALESEAAHRRILVASGGALAVAVLGGMMWLTAIRMMLSPARRLARGARALAESRLSEQPVPVPANHALGDLPGAVEALADALAGARREVRKAMQSATASMDEQKAWLETILQGLTEGVLVCNRQHRIMLYNQSLLSTLGRPERVGLGRSVFDLLSRAPLQHTLDRLERRHHSEEQAGGNGRSTGFVCSTQDGQNILHGRMALMLDRAGEISGYLITLTDISDDIALLGSGEAVRYTLTRELRGTVANLRAAAENLTQFPDMDSAQRANFTRIVLSESTTLSTTIDQLAGQISGHLLGRWPMADVLITDLVNCLDQTLADLEVSVVGIPLWVHGDSLSLMQALEHLIRKLSQVTGESQFDIETMLGDKFVYVDISWQGTPIPAGQLENWLDEVCTHEGGQQRLGNILERHDSEMWSQPGTLEGTAVLRLPLPSPLRPQFIEASDSLPARPEFYDFGLLSDHQGDASLASQPLDALNFVVFDCEMTGLNPKGGDEVIAIAGIRVVKGRILRGETFERLINPGFSIPKDSIRFHGITDDDVADKPGITEVLPEFRDFVGDSILVAHNAAFDMTFLQLKEKATQVRFDNPVMDTLLLSSMLDGDEEEHSLDAICERYRIDIEGRHTAMGDTLATAEVLIRVIERLQGKGLRTFGEAMQASSMAAQLRHRTRMIQ